MQGAIKAVKAVIGSKSGRKGGSGGNDSHGGGAGGDVELDEAVNAAEKHIPSGSWLYKVLDVAKRGPPYTLEALGSSVFILPLGHATLRGMIGVGFLGIGVTGLRRFSKSALPVSLVYGALFLLLAGASILKRSQIGVGRGGVRSGWICVREATALGLVYQCLASIALWMFPLAILAACRNLAKGGRARNHVLKYIAHGLPCIAFLVDCFVLGTVPNFHLFGIIPPILIEGVLIYVGYYFNKIPTPPEPNGEVITTLLRLIVQFFVWVLCLWAVLSALLVVPISKASSCFKRDSEQEDETNSENVVVDEENGNVTTTTTKTNSSTANAQVARENE